MDAGRHFGRYYAAACIGRHAHAAGARQVQLARLERIAGPRRNPATLDGLPVAPATPACGLAPRLVPGGTGVRWGLGGAGLSFGVGVGVGSSSAISGVTSGSSGVGSGVSSGVGSGVLSAFSSGASKSAINSGCSSSTSRRPDRTSPNRRNANETDVDQQRDDHHHRDPTLGRRAIDVGSLVFWFHSER